MTLTEYQQRAMVTCMPSCDNFCYMFLNLVGEMGELASKVAKQIRRREVSVNDCKLSDSLTPEQDVLLQAEAGDILWQLSGLCSVMGWSLDEVAIANLNKLASRQQRGVIDGNGDER